MPPLFVVGPEGNTSELVNYRVRGRYMIVDRLFAAAELRFGDSDFTNTYFGVSDAEALNSGYAPHHTDGGIYAARLSLDAHRSQSCGN